MRILIVGAGIAGCSLAGFLRRRPHQVTIVERSRSLDRLGYMISLWPLGTRILIGLELIDQFRDAAAPIGTYHIRDGTGGLVNAYRLVDLLSPHGDAGTLWRADLLRLLLSRLDRGDIRLDTTVSSLEQTGQDVRVKFSDASEGRYDLVVGADGIHSSVRRLLLGDVPLTATGWGGWVWWAPSGVIPMNDVTEYWGAGRFVGLYPTRGNIGVFAGGPIEAVEVPPGSTLRHHLAGRFAALREPLGPVLDSVPDSDEVVLWRLDDVRSPDWHRGRVVLIGDAATAFLPSAGVGASMALESSAVLADELLRVEAASVPHALRMFEKRHRRRVERAQQESRNLARAMTVTSRPAAWARDEIMKHYSVERLVKNLVASLDEPV